MQLVKTNVFIALGGALIFLANFYIPDISMVISRWRQGQIEQQTLGSKRRIYQEVMLDWELRSRWISQVLFTIVSGLFIVGGFGDSIEQIETEAAATIYILAIAAAAIIFNYLMMLAVRKKGGGRTAQTIVIETIIITIAGALIIGAAWKSIYIPWTIIAASAVIILANVIFLLTIKSSL